MKTLALSHFLIISIASLIISCKDPKRKLHSRPDPVTTSCPSEPNCPETEAPQADYSGTLLFESLPPDLTAATYYLLIDEKSVFNEKVSRISEKKLPVSSGYRRNYGYCGTTSLALRSQAYSENPNRSYNNTSDTSTVNDAYILSENSAAESDQNDFGFDFTAPDERSEYFVGILVDIDGDGHPSPGDYFTKEFISFVPDQNQNDMVIRLEKISIKEELLLQVQIANFSDLELADTSTITIELTQGSTDEVVATQTQDIDPESDTYDFVGIPPTAKDRYYLRVAIDNDDNGTLDEDDYETEEDILIEMPLIGDEDDEDGVGIYELNLSSPPS